MELSNPIGIQLKDNFVTDKIYNLANLHIILIVKITHSVFLMNYAAKSGIKMNLSISCKSLLFFYLNK